MSQISSRSQRAGSGVDCICSYRPHPSSVSVCLRVLDIRMVLGNAHLVTVTRLHRLTLPRDRLHSRRFIIVSEIFIKPLIKISVNIWSLGSLWISEI